MQFVNILRQNDLIKLKKCSFFRNIYKIEVGFLVIDTESFDIDIFDTTQLHNSDLSTFNGMRQNWRPLFHFRWHWYLSLLALVLTWTFASDTFNTITNVTSHD